MFFSLTHYTLQIDRIALLQFILLQHVVSYPGRFDVNTNSLMWVNLMSKQRQDFNLLNFQPAFKWFGPYFRFSITLPHWLLVLPCANPLKTKRHSSRHLIWTLSLFHNRGFLSASNNTVAGENKASQSSSFRNPETRSGWCVYVQSANFTAYVSVLGV